MINNIRIKVSTVTFKEIGDKLVFGDSKELLVNNPYKELDSKTQGLSGENDMII